MIVIELSEQECARLGGALWAMANQAKRLAPGEADALFKLHAKIKAAYSAATGKKW